MMVMPSQASLSLSSSAPDVRATVAAAERTWHWVHPRAQDVRRSSLVTEIFRSVNDFWNCCISTVRNLSHESRAPREARPTLTGNERSPVRMS